MIKELLTEQACINFLGKKTILKFSFASEGILEYKSVTPLKVNDEYLNVTVEIFYESDHDFFCYDTLDKLAFKKQIFELRIETFTGKKQTIYHKKYNDNHSNN